MLVYQIVLKFIILLSRLVCFTK